MRRLLFGTTSYVVPDDLVPNVRLLAPCVDDIELVLFEGETSNLPDARKIREMIRIAEDTGCGFTVHLPLDSGLGEPDRNLRRRAQDLCARVVETTSWLQPRAVVVHPELPLAYHAPPGADPQFVHSLAPAVFAAWHEALGESLLVLRDLAAPSPLALENIHYPYRWLDGALEDPGLKAAVDVGHLLKAGIDPQHHIARHGRSLAVVHLHGLSGGRDHVELAHLDPVLLRDLLLLLARLPMEGEAVNGPIVVTVETFGWETTARSLETLSREAEALFPALGDPERLRAAAGIIDAAGKEGWCARWFG